jgi:hypothetical protein
VLSISAQELNEVQRQPTAREQYWHALALNTEEAFQSVAKFHSPDENATNRYFARRAQQQLAAYYLQSLQFERALEVYRELAALEEMESEFRAIGLAGQVIVYDRLGDKAQAAQWLGDAMAHRNELDRQQGEELDRIYAKFREAGGS